jgi:hypothetical protein
VGRVEIGHNVVNIVSYPNLPPSSKEFRPPCVAAHDVGLGGYWVVPRFALSVGSASVLQTHLVAVGPTLIIILGFVKWAATINLFIVSCAELAPIPADYRR